MSRTAITVPTSPVTVPQAAQAALAFADLLLDAGSFRSWDAPPLQPDQGPEYARQLARARERSGADESVLTGEGAVGGRRLALLLGEFGFLGGSVGVAATERLVRAVERATAQRLPLFAAPVSGGTRMQEGTPAFVGMTRIAAALTRHRAARLPYLVHLRHPCTGGVFASWGSLGQVTTAEPGALVGFLGPRVHEALVGQPFPPDVQTAENLHRVGIVDAVLDPEGLRGHLARLLPLLEPVPAIPGGPGRVAAPPPARRPVWESVLRTRRPDWPGVRELLSHATEFVELHGTGEGERDDAVVLGVARFGERSCVLAGQDRTAPTAVGPGGLRTVRRGIRLAGELALPFVSVIDTAGAELSRAAEEGALAGEIARCLAELSALRTPRLAVLLGQGTGGAALALFAADRVLAVADAWLAPLPPEGASAILHRDTAHAAQLAERQAVSARALHDRGLVHHLVATPGELATALTRELSRA